jgi:hypothetical protein
VTPGAPEGPLVVGFTDSAGQNGAVATSLEGDSAALLLIDGEANAGEVTDIDAGGSARVKSGGRSLVLGGTPRYEPLALDEEEHAAAALLVGEATLEGPRRKLDGFGHLTRWRKDPPWRDNELVRHLAGTLEDGSLLLAGSARPRGAAGHDEEAIAAWLVDPDGTVEGFAEPLVSTQYDGGGLPTRAGLELWGADPEAPARRAAATKVAVASTEIGEWRLDGAFMRWSFEGRTGSGTYLIWTR